MQNGEKVAVFCSQENVSDDFDDPVEIQYYNTIPFEKAETHSIDWFTEYYLLKKGNWGIASRFGKLIAPMSYDSIVVCEKKATVYGLQKNGKWGVAEIYEEPFSSQAVIDRFSLQETIPIEYDKIEKIPRSSWLLVEKNGKQVVRNFKVESILLLEFDNMN